jgi:DNA-binding NarL/FixJ family response regulator
MRVVIADNESRIRSVLGVVAREMNVTVIAEVSQVEALLEYVSNSLPDVILLGWELPGLVPEIHLPALRLFGLGAKIIIMSNDPNEQLHAMATGADGFLSKNDSPHRLLEVVYSVHVTEHKTPQRVSQSQHQPVLI